MWRKDTLVDKGLQATATVPYRSFPVFARSSTADVLKLTRRVPRVLMLDTFPPSTGTQSALEQLPGRGFTAHLQHLHIRQVVCQRAVALDTVLLRGTLLGIILAPVEPRIILIIAVGAALLLNNDMCRFQFPAQVPDDGTAGNETVVVDANHWLEVLYLFRREHVKGSTTNQRSNR